METVNGRPRQLAGIKFKDFTPAQRRLYWTWQWAKNGGREMERRKTVEHVKINRRTYIRNYKRWRKERDPAYKLGEKLRSTLSIVIRSQAKKSCLEPLLGCSIFELRTHFESQFEAGMSWQNYGSLWQIDHIRQVATFNLLDPKQLAECFHYTNLRPRLEVLNHQESRASHNGMELNALQVA